VVEELHGQSINTVPSSRNGMSGVILANLSRREEFDE
jgi:hypothetical protein